MLKRMKQLLYFGSKLLSLICMLPTHLGFLPRHAYFFLLVDASSLTTEDEQELRGEMIQLDQKGYLPLIIPNKQLKNTLPDKECYPEALEKQERSTPRWIMLLDS